MRLNFRLVLTSLVLLGLTVTGLVPAAQADANDVSPAPSDRTAGRTIAETPTLGQWVSQRASMSRQFFSSAISPAWVPSTGISRDAWKSSLADPAVRVGASGRAFVIEPRATASEISATVSAPAALYSSISTADAFVLHSNPGADRVIYLDFTGYVLSDSGWNLSGGDGDPGVPDGTVFAPYDTDGNTATFSSAERQAIIEAWSLVAEDYAAFDVNVTTEDPGAEAIYRNGADDVNYGSRAVITGFNNPIAESCECGGIAYVGIFDLDRDAYSGTTDYSPAWVWAEAGMSGKIIADIVSHEVGHNLGLSHDGLAVSANAQPIGNNSYYLGSGAWGPIMGAGYGVAITHWSDGGYTGISQNGDGATLVGNNSEDDYAVMQSYGLPLRPDDAGDTPATASSVDVATPLNGIIEDPADIDYYSFVATGLAHTVSVTSPALTPNLDTLLVISSATGVEIARSNPTISWTGGNTVNGMGASATFNTTIGTTYFIEIQGTASSATGVAVFSDYGSIGEYTLSVETASEEFAASPTPTITGTLRVGATLTAVPGAWSPVPEFAYQWKRGVTVVGTSSTYTPTSADLGSALTVTVTGSLSGYSPVSKVSAPTAAVGYGVFATSPVPTVSGTARVGTRLTAVTGTWSPSATLSYQWKRGTAVVGTSSTYTPVSADRGSRLTVTVTGALPGYTSVTRVSALTAAVGYGVFTASPVPTVSGTARVGTRLTAVTGTWSPSATLSYQWKRGTTVVGTSSTYTPKAADRGSRLTVKVTGTRSGFTTVSKVSALTATVGYGVFATSPVPTVSGTARVGTRLTAVTGTWSPSATLSYQWKRGTTVVGTSSTYTPKAADRGSRLTVKVTGTRSGFTTVSKVSALTATVGYGVFATSPVPRVSGTARVGTRLTAVTGTWSPSATLSYKWKRGTTVVGTSSTYTPKTADRGSRLTVTVTGSRSGYTSKTVTSAVTLPVQ